MRLLAVAGLALAQPDTFASGFTQEGLRLTPQGAEAVWEKRAGEMCTGFDISPSRHPSERFSNAQCAVKCFDATEPGCEGFIPGTDDQFSDSLCVDEATCKEICWDLDECMGVDMHNTLPRCFLNNWECAGRVAEFTLADSAEYSMHIKQVPWTAECPLGLFVEVSGGGDSVDGTFKSVEGDSSTYARADDNARVHWDGCQWAVQKRADDDDAAVVVAPTCSDNVEAVNFLFGRADDVYDDHLCAMGENAGYCHSALFAGVCPETCMVPVEQCRGDNNDAANHLAEHWEVSAVGCGLCETEGADDPVVAAVCRASCPAARRLARAPADRGARSFGLMDYAQVSHSFRRLAAQGDWEDYFWSQFDEVGWTPECSAKSPDITLLNDDHLCDVQKFELPVAGLRLHSVCPLQPAYATSTGRYCRLQHVNLVENDVEVVGTGKSVSQHRCYAKCKAGDAEGCEGNDPLFLDDSQALCLAREQCEAVCSAIAGCVSVDMHESLPRCYLNRACDAEADDHLYNLLTKTDQSIAYATTSGAFCDLHPAATLQPAGGVGADLCLAKCNPFGAPCEEGDQQRGCFCDGVTGLDPASASDASALCLSREHCEAVCTSLEDCASFDMHQSMNRCYLNMVSAAECPDGLQSDSLYEIVDKIPARPCYPRLLYDETPHGGEDAHRVEGFSGDYDTITEPEWPSPHGCEDQTAFVRAQFNGLTCPEAATYGMCSMFESALAFVCPESCAEEFAANGGKCGAPLDYDDAFDALFAMDYLDAVMAEGSGGCAVGAAAGACSNAVARSLCAAACTVPKYHRGENTISFAGCWKVSGPDGWKFSSVAMAEGEDLCDHPHEEVAADLNGTRGNTSLYFAGCPGKAGMTIERTCLGMSRCPVLTRCIVTEERMVVELDAQRPHEGPFVAAAHDPALWKSSPAAAPEAPYRVKLDECAAHVGSRTALPAKQIASPNRAEYTMAPGLYGPHFLGHAVYRDEPDAPQVSFTAVKGDKVIASLTPPPPAMPEGCEDDASFKTFYYYGCGDWAAECSMGNAILDCADYADMASYDGSACEVGGQFSRNDFPGLPAGGFFFSAAYMQDIRDHCPTACYECVIPPAGFSGFVSDIISIEAVDVVDKKCTPVADDATIDFTVYTHPGTGVGVMNLQGKAAVVQDFATGMHSFTASLHKGSGQFVAVADINECEEETDTCSRTSEDCVNSIGAYKCVCKDGYSRAAGLAGLGGCTKDEFECPLLRVRVSNAEAMDLGWRLREMQLYSDEHCSAPVVVNALTAYAVQDGAACVGDEIEVYNHQREVVRAMQCFTKCWSGVHRGARKLSPKRRMQLFPNDWNNCGGKAAQNNDQASNELCASTAACEDVCNELKDECAGFTVTGANRCILHKACALDASTSTSYKKMPVVKGTSSHALSTAEKLTDAFHGLHASWKDHGVALVTDGWGFAADAAAQPATAGALSELHSLLPHGLHSEDFWNTEWWSQCYECDANEAFVELTVQIPEGMPCHIHSVWLAQDDEYGAKSLNFAAGATAIGYGQDDAAAFPGCGSPPLTGMTGCEEACRGLVFVPADGICTGCFEGSMTRLTETDAPTLSPAGEWCSVYSLGPRPDDARELPAISDFYSTWHYETNGQTNCYSITCGSPGMYSGVALREVEDVESPCLCKQLCLETDGCEVYNLYKEEDNNYEFATTTPDHHHTHCYLIGGPWSKVDVDSPNWVSGTVQTALNSASLADGVLTVAGYHLSDSNARVKIVKWTDTQDNCADPLADTVGGIGCSDSFICAPKPATTSSTKATWTGISIAASEEEQKYRVCYCSGPCYAGWQYSPVGRTALAVDGRGFAWQFAGDKSCSVGRDKTTSIVVDRPIFFDLSESEHWEIKVVSATQTCDADAAARVAAAAASDQHTDNATFVLTVDDHREAAGRYVVCLRMCGTSAQDCPWFEISGRTCDSRYLELEFIAADLEAPAGYFTSQKFSGMFAHDGAWDAHVDFTVKGNYPAADFGTYFTDHVGVVVGTECWHSAGNVSRSAITADGATFRFNTSNSGLRSSELAAGKYDVVADCTADVDQRVLLGELTLSARVDAGWTYVLDPTVSGSIEVTGTGLDWRNDRIMLVDCEATCGISSPANVHIEGAPQTLLGANTFVAQNTYFDNPSEDDHPSMDLPTDLYTYHEVTAAYCIGHNIPAGAAAGATGAFLHDQCYGKCATCIAAGTCTAEMKCGGFLPAQDGPNSGALCLAEAECKTLCTGTADCVGIDMYRDLNRCYLNSAAPTSTNTGGEAHDSCTAQFDAGKLGIHQSYKYLHLFRDAGARRLAPGAGLSHASMLRFAPVDFSGGGSYKVCFCDHDLLPHGQTHCLAEADYSIEVGKVYASGVSCLLSDEKFRRGTCYEQYHGGLACSDSLTREAPAGALPATAGLPSAYDIY